MTDQSDLPDAGLSDAGLPGLTPAEDVRVRRLLAEAGETGPMPAEVAARLDGVLADLRNPVDAPAAAEDAPGSSSAVVVPISPWPKRVLGGLVAAAAVVLGVAVVPQLAGSDGADESTASDSSDRAGAAESGPLAKDGADPDAEMAAPVPATSPDSLAGESRAGLGADVATLSREELRQTARRLRAGEAARFQTSTAAPCGSPDPAARVVWVRYAGADAALVYLPVVDGRQPVELWTCPGPDVVETVSLPAP